MFLGHSMVDVHINELSSIKNAVTKTQLFKNVDTTISEALVGDEERYNKFFKDGIIRNLRIVNNDFSFNNEIERAFEVKEFLN